MNISKQKYYTSEFGLNIKQLEILEAMPQSIFAEWVRNGENKSQLTEYGLEQLRQTERAYAKTGQKPPSQEPTPLRGNQAAAHKAILAGEKIGEDGINLRPNRMANAIDHEAAEQCLIDFANQYNQLAVTQQNFGRLADFIGSRGGAVTFNNLEIAYRELLAAGQLEIRVVERRPVAKTPQQQDGNKSRREKMFTSFGVSINAPKQKKAAHNPVVESTPTPATEIVEIIYTPEQTRNFTSDELKRFMLPLKFTGVDTISNMSADAFYQASPKLQNHEAPYLLQRRFWNEWERFTKSDVGRGWVNKLKTYGLEGDAACRRILDYIAANNLNHSEVSFRQAAEATLYAISISITDDDKGILRHNGSVIHTDRGSHPDQLNLGKSMAGQIPPGSSEENKTYSESEVRRLIRVLDSRDYLKLLNDSPAFKRAVTQYLGS